jgi:tetratricopeptide (TPR) repeat protein
VKFRADRVADVGLLALGIALPCGVVAYFTLADGRDTVRSGAAQAPMAEARPTSLSRVEVGARAAAGERDEAAKPVEGSGSGHAQPAEPTQSEPASATSISSTLARRAETLLSGDPGLRAESAHWLSHLESDSLDAVAARLAELSTHRPAPEAVARVFAALAKNDADSDLAVAAANLLERERTAAVLAVVEPLFYLRSLETMVGAEGHSELAVFVELDAGAWSHELTRTAQRLGRSLVPALLGMRSHESQAVRRFASEQLAALGCSEPKAVLSGNDPYLLARAIRAYSSPPDYAAMPAIVRLTGDARIQVRRAARDAVRRFGRNAVWQLRELYDEVSGQPADKRWDHERTADELYAVLDRPRVEEADTLLARGLQALTRGDLTAMRRDFDALLAKYPDFERRDRLAAGYAALGEQLFRRDRLSASLAAYRRALRLAPETADAKRWQAQVAFVSAEYSLTRGVVDLTGYTRALELDPNLRQAREAIERLSGTRTRHVRDMRRMAAVLALVLLLTCVVILLRRTPTDRASATDATSTLPETESEPSR